MDQDRAFEDWWKEKRASTFAQMIVDMGEEQVKRLSREAWYAALNAQDDEQVPTESMLHDLSKRGGSAAILAECGLLAIRKGADYNTGFDRDAYFPLGLASYAQMLWVKCLRLVSFAKTPREEQNEAVRDTLLDLINYATFAADWLTRRPDRRKP